MKLCWGFLGQPGVTALYSFPHSFLGSLEEGPQTPVFSLLFCPVVTQWPTLLNPAGHFPCPEGARVPLYLAEAPPRYLFLNGASCTPFLRHSSNPRYSADIFSHNVLVISWCDSTLMVGFIQLKWGVSWALSVASDSRLCDHHCPKTHPNKHNLVIYPQSTNITEEHSGWKDGCWVGRYFS